MEYKTKQKMLWAVIVLVIAGFLFMTPCLHFDDSYNIGPISSVDEPQRVVVAKDIGTIGGADGPQNVIVSNGIGRIGGADGPQYIMISPKNK